MVIWIGLVTRSLIISVWGGTRRDKSRALEGNGVGSNPTSSSYQLCDLGKSFKSCWASVSASVRWNSDRVHLRAAVRTGDQAGRAWCPAGQTGYFLIVPRCAGAQTPRRRTVAPRVPAETGQTRRRSTDARVSVRLWRRCLLQWVLKDKRGPRKVKQPGEPELGAQGWLDHGGQIWAEGPLYLEGSGEPWSLFMLPARQREEAGVSLESMLAPGRALWGSLTAVVGAVTKAEAEGSPLRTVDLLSLTHVPPG